MPALCLTCHGSTATGADTNVEDGVYQDRDPEAEAPAEGMAGRGLRAGGFRYVLMDADLDGAPASAAATSTHVYDGTPALAWGNGSIGSGAGKANFTLTCVSCHDPHGGGTYRSLRPIPTGSGAGAPVTPPDEPTKHYTVSDAANNYLNEDYGTLSADLARWCAQCHTRYHAGTASGRTASGDPIFAYRHNTEVAPCVKCHVAHGTAATMTGLAADVPWPDGSPTPNGDARSSLLRGDNRAVCTSCHLSGDSVVGVCDACHGAPPNTGAHSTHASPDVVGYGLTGSFATATAYAFGCGECHPLDIARHADGTVDVDLTPGGASPFALKSRNAPTAAFDGNTCGGVYCHSGKQVSSGAVGRPLDNGGNPLTYQRDAYGNLLYDPYTVTVGRSYQTTPDWFTGALSGQCTDCHAFPPTTAYPQVQAGVGDSHQWIDDYGYGNLHAYNMSFDPIPCRTCHYGEITQANTWSRDANAVTTYDPVPLADRTRHVNGQADVAFDTVNPVEYVSAWSGTTTYWLTGATYDPVRKSCTNVPCHLNQTYVVWGSPYRWWIDPECDLCHRYYGP